MADGEFSRPRKPRLQADRDVRGGKDYDSTFGSRMTGKGPIAWMIGRRFEVACERLGSMRPA